MRRGRAKALVAVVGLCAFFAAASVASAAYMEVGHFAGDGSGPGGSGSGDGELLNPGQADVNDATGNLYVADTGNDRVQIFEPNATGGEYDSQAAVPGAVGLAIDQSDGAVYVATATGIAKLTSALAPAAGWTDPAVTGPLAVDPASGDVLVADTAGNLIRRYNSDGTADGSFAAERPLDLDVDSSGDVLVVTSTGDLNACAASTVKRFSAAGVEEGVIGATLAAPGAIAVDPDDDSIVIASRVNHYSCGTELPLVSFFSAGGTETESHALPAATQYATVPGLAARGGASTRVYVVTKSPFNDPYGATRVTAFEVPEPTAPEVVGQSALRGENDATLRASIDAGGLATDYHFEYGTTPAYGEETAPGALPASFSPAKVSAAIGGLEAGTTYHYRVVAENSIEAVAGPDRTFTTTSASTACPNEAFRTGAAAQLSDCRAFELVTPVSSQADIRIAGGPVTPDGDTVCFATEDQLLDADPNGIKSADQGFCSWRTALGWETKWVTGPASPNPPAYALGANVYYISPDGRRAVFASDGVLFGNDFLPAPIPARGGHMSAYMWEGGSTTWLSPPGPEPSDPPVYKGDDNGNQRRPLAASEDLTRGIFESERRILPADENTATDLYEWFPGGLRLVSFDSAGKAAGGSAGSQPGFMDEFGIVEGSNSQRVAPPGGMSRDGRRIFFQHGGAPLDGDATEAPEGPEPETYFGNVDQIQSVYMREGDEVTLISPRRGSGPNTSVWFVGADADGEIAYLETTQQLTPEAKDSGRAIYSYDVATDQLELVATAPTGVKFLTLSADGSTIVYSERQSGELVLVRDGVAVTLGTFSAADREGEGAAGSFRADQRKLRVTPDGRVVVFAASGEFGPYGPGPVQVYRWEAGAGLERISAVDGGDPELDASIGAYSAGTPGERQEFWSNNSERANSGRVMSDDGERVFFETPEALLNRDVNGFTDVYEWHDGEIALISTGTGTKALYHGNSADGSTVFITTFERLLPEWDRNARRDLYAVTTDGGFAPPPPPPGCQGEACQTGQSPPPPASAGKGSGEGNFRRGLAGASLAKGGKSIRVSVLAPGTVTATLRGKLGKGKATTVARARKAARAPGALILPIKLSPGAGKALAERGRLPLTLQVTHVQSDQTIARKVTIHG